MKILTDDHRPDLEFFLQRFVVLGHAIKQLPINYNSNSTEQRPKRPFLRFSW